MEKANNLDSFGSRYGSELGKALRAVDKRFMEYFPIKGEYNVIHSPMSPLLGLWYMGDITAKAVARKAAALLDDYDLITVSPKDGGITSDDKVLLRRINKVRKIISDLTGFNPKCLEDKTKTVSFAV